MSGRCNKATSTHDSDSTVLYDAACFLLQDVFRHVSPNNGLRHGGISSMFHVGVSKGASTRLLLQHPLGHPYQAQVLFTMLGTMRESVHRAPRRCLW